MAIRNPVRRAKGVERALAISLLIFTGIRVKNLRSLRLDRNVVRRGDRVFLSFTDDEMKSGNALELELPGETIRLLDTFLKHHRGRLAGADGPYLFPGPDGEARSYSAMREAVSKPLLKHAGIELSPHLYRHIIAKIVAERAPEMLPDLSRRLGHKSINTTYQSYLGTETPAASRRINQLLQETRARPKLGGRTMSARYRGIHLPFDRWPAPDRAAWEELFREGNPLDGCGAACHWAEATRRTNLKHYARWLGWLDQAATSIRPHSLAARQPREGQAFMRRCSWKRSPPAPSPRRSSGSNACCGKCTPNRTGAG